MLFPIDDLAVGLVGVLSAEGRPADEALEHDGSDRPPIAAEGVALASENLRGDVVWSSNC